MLVSSLDVTRLEEVPYKSAAKNRAAQAGVRLHRRVYDGGDCIIKLWPADWLGWNVVVDGAGRRRFRGAGDSAPKVLPGTTLGIYDARFVPAFGEYIYTDDGDLVGYTTRKGMVVEKADVDGAPDCITLVDDLIVRSISSGYILRDLHAGNLIRLPDGRLSLIDLETPLARLDTLDLNNEVANGALRRGTSQRYRQFIFDYMDRRHGGDWGRAARPNGPAVPSSSSPDMAWILDVERELMSL
jgi:hypothetical protein